MHWLVPHDPLNQNLSQEVGRNSYENPGLMFNDVALEKGLTFANFERVKLDLKAEVQNIGNHNNIGIENTTVNNIGNGLFQNRANAEIDAGRVMGLWVKVVF